VSNSAEVCHVYWIDGGTRSVKKWLPCPRELNDGEKMRLTGKTCLRESDDRSRNVPVRCAKYLFRMQTHDAEGSGEYRLPPAASAQ
jgi:hypothetical protein